MKDNIFRENIYIYTGFDKSFPTFINLRISHHRQMLER